MSKIDCMSEGQIEGLAKVLGECGSGSDITRVLTNCGLSDNSRQSTKWRRLYGVFLDIQHRDQCANKIIDFIQAFLAPARFVGRNNEFEIRREELNTVLAFSGLEYESDGKFRKRQAAQTLTEAERRANTIQGKLQGRCIHPRALE